MVECNLPPPGRTSSVVGDMRPLRVHCFGKIPMTTHSKQVDVQIKLLDVACAPGVRFNVFSLHAVMPKCSVSLDAEGVHMLDGVLSLRRDAGCYVAATRIIETPIAAAVLAPGKMRIIDTIRVQIVERGTRGGGGTKGSSSNPSSMATQSKTITERG